MAETNEFDAYWDEKLRQRNLEVGVTDGAKGVAGAAVKGVGSLVSNLSAGDIARGARGLVDPTMNKVEEGGVIDTALTWLNDTFDHDGNERRRISDRVKALQASGSLPKSDDQNKELTVAALPGLSALTEPLKGAEVVGDIADKAIKPAAKIIGEPIKEVGQGIIESTSPDMQEAMSNPEIFKDGKLGRGAGDPAAWAGVAAQAAGSLIPTVATAAITKNPTAGLGIGMGMSVGQAGDSAYDTAINSNPMDLIDSPIFVGELKKVSQDPEFSGLDGVAKVEEAQRRYAELSSSMAKSKPETMAAAAMGTLLGDATIVKTMLGSGAGGAVRGMLKGAATEAPGEFGEEWLQQYVGNTTQNQMANTQLVDPMAGTLDAGLHGAAGGVMAGGAMGGTAAKFAKVLHVNRDNLTQEQAIQIVESSMKKRGADDATARQVAEQAASMMANPELSYAENPMTETAGQAADQSPLGPSASKFDELRDVPAYLRRDGTTDRFKGMAENSPVQEALAGTPAPTVDDILSQATSQQVDAIEDPAISSQQKATEENAMEQPTAATDTSGEPVADDAAQAQPLEQNAEPSALDAVVGPLQTLRITRKGKPFSSEKEAAMASRKGKEMPVPLNGGGFGVAEIAEVEQAKAATTTQPSAPQLDNISVTDPNQPSDQPAASVSAETVPAPSATAGEASQPAPAIDTGYREVIPVNQPQAEVSNEPVTPVPASGSEGQGDQPGAGEPAAAGAGPAIARLTDRAGSGDPADNTPAPPVPDGQQQNDPTLTAPAIDAGAAVSDVAQPESVAPAPAAAQTPWAEAIDNPDGTITLKGDVPLIKQWAKESGVKAVPGKGGLLVATSSAAKVREYVAPAASEPVPKIEGDASPVRKVRMSQQRAELSADEVAQIVSDFRREYKGTRSLDFIVGQTQEDLYGPEGSPERIGWRDGGYLPSKQQVHLIADSITRRAGRQDIYEGAGGEGGVSGHSVLGQSDRYSPGNGQGVGRVERAKAEVVSTLRHEVLGHYGLDTFTPENKQSLLKKLSDAKNEKWLKPTWSEISRPEMYGGDSDLHQAEEVFARLTESALPSRSIQAWNDIKTELSRMLRKIGLAKGPIKEHELDSLIRAVGKGIRNGERTLQNIRGDKEVTGKQAGEPAKPGKPERIISFSKQAMAQGEKPAKHLTRKEAELVTKEWFKQYRGASGIDVQIHATQTELEKALGLVAKDGLIRRAAFDDDTGTLHVAADTIANPKRMREILRHEVLAHYGLANVLGDGEYTKLISRLIKSKKDPSMKAVWEWVDTHYADEDIGVQAEEVIAHLAELEPSAWRRGWDTVAAWVTKALRMVGFAPDGITAAETRNLIEALGKKMKRGSPDDGGPDGGKKFSQEAEKAKKSDVKMSQSVADDGHVLEQSIRQKAEYQAGAALGTIKNWMKQGRPVLLGTLTDLQIDQVYRDITGGAVSEYQRLRTQMEAERNDILLDAETRIDPLWDALGKQDKADLSNLMHDATMARLHPDKSLDENSYYREVKQKAERAKKPEARAAYEAELHIIERNHSELARQYNALPANAKDLYGTMLDTYTKQWESLRGAIEQRLEDLLGVSEGRAMAAEMRQKMEHALQHGPYFPLTRYGDYVVKARKGDEYVREHFERRADAEQAVKQYQRDGYNAVMTVKEEGGGDSANANQLGMEMLNFLDNADGVSKTALKDEIWQAMLRMMPDASYAKHAIHRRRVKGASRDAHRAYLNSVYHYARHVSKIRYGHKMQGELDKLSEQIRAGVAGEPSSLKPEDLEIAQQVLNEMNKRHDLNMNPTGKAWAGSAGNIGFLYYIAGSVASAVINTSQNFTVMLPQLGAKYGFARSAAAMTMALGDYFIHGKFKAGTTEAWRSLTRSTTLPTDERAILDRLYRAGALDLTQANSIASKADTDQQDVKQMGKRGRVAMRWAGALFHNAEVLNREVAALAAYRLLKQAEPTLDGQQYADRVAEMVYDGHGNYAASNRPRYMRNDLVKVLTQFKIYAQMMTYVLYANAIKAAKGDKVAAKTLGGVLATSWVMSGVMGLPTPISAVAYALAAAFDDDDDRSGEASFRLALTEALGPRAGELLAKGPMDALTNLSIAGRTGLGDLWWRSPKEGTEGDDLAWHAVQQLLGPVAGIGINLARGAGQMTDGHIQRGLETMLPKSIRDVAKAYRQATEGEQTIKGDIIMDDVSTWNVAMQGLGFGSAQMAKNYDAREYIKGKEKRIADKRSQLLTDYYMARKSGDMDEVQEVLERIKMFNAIHHPGERITGKSLALSFKAKLRSNERTQGGVYLNRNREYLREEGRFAD